MKETHYKLRHRVTALFAAAVMLCSMLPGAAFAEEPTPQPTEETVQMKQQTEPSETDNGQTDESSPDPGEDVTEATPETAEEQPSEEEIPAAVVGAELYTDLPDAPIGSYIGSEGLPVATGSTKIGISEWPESQLEESGSYLTAAALDNDGLTMAAPLLDGADYAIVPIMVQVEYPADGSSTDMILPDGVTLLDFYGEPAADTDTLLHNSYHETSAAVMGVYVQAAADFTAQLVYTDPDGSTQTKTLYVTIDREHTVASPFADAGIAAYGERPIPDVTSGKITKVAKVNGTWLIWFNGDEAYCCTPGADGQPKNCPLYTYVDTSMVGADQYVPGDHYGNQFRIWGGLTQLSLGMQELPPVAFSAEAPSLLDFCRTIYTDAQMQIIENYPDSTAAKILMGSAQALFEGTDAYASARGYYTYIYQPGRAGWQTVAVIGPEISDDEPNPKPIVQEIYANWEAPAQTASGSFDFDYGIITDKVQLKTTEKVDGATIEIEPITKSGTIDGGTWNISPADKQTVTTAGHTNDDNFQNNGGAASASWTLHYSVSKTTDSRCGRVGPYTTQDEADAAADSARDAAIAELQGEAQRMVDNAVASAKTELANIKFRYEEVGVPYGFEMYWGSNGSKQTISVPANSNNAYLMKNDEWSLQVNIKKTDSETGNQIAADAQYEIFQWDTVTGKYQPTGGYNTYSVQRQGNGTYAVINSAAYATTDSMRHTLYYTQRNTGKFIIVESKAPTGYFGDWTDINHPGIANTPLGKRGYYIEITEDSDNSVIWLDNADYNADIAATDKGGTKLVTSTGVETTVTIYDTAKDPSRTYNTDNSGKAANEDNYTVAPTDGVMKNDRTLGEISISKVDLDAVRYVGGSTAHGTALASGQTHGDAALDGAVYDLYAAEDITHPDGVTGVVDYSKIVDADGNPIWHTTIRDNSGQWVNDYLPILKKDHLVASAKIEDGWLTFANLYLGKYYVVERSTGTVIPLRDGALVVSSTYPTVDSRTKAATGQAAALDKNGSGQYTDWVYKNQFSTVSKGKALDGSWTYDAYYLSFADGYLVDEHMFNSRKFAEMTSRDEMFLSRMGLEQRALFIVLPDNDTTFNFIATMLYTQLFDQLFRLADSTPEYNGALPVHVRLMMDEFANVALPKNFKNILAVCRSRNISCDIILQNIAQLKSLFKDDWEGIIGNCDTLLYLGGNEYGTYEYLSKILGKETERTKSQSIGKGSRGSSSDSLQTAGRELCMPDEIRRMRDDECLLLMRSEDPVIDKKYNLLHHPNVKYTPDAGGEPYVMPPDYMGDAATITMDAVAAATAPEITEEMYEQLDYLEKHPEENYYENEENFSQYDQGD